jgi:hypothetical protein
MIIQIIFEFELFSLLDHDEAISVLCSMPVWHGRTTRYGCGFVPEGTSEFEPNPTHFLLGSSTICS